MVSGADDKPGSSADGDAGLSAAAQVGTRADDGTFNGAGDCSCLVGSTAEMPAGAGRLQLGSSAEIWSDVTS